jgi:hypothetical protein
MASKVSHDLRLPDISHLNHKLNSCGNEFKRRINPFAPAPTILGRWCEAGKADNEALAHWKSGNILPFSRRRRLLIKLHGSPI